MGYKTLDLTLIGAKDLKNVSMLGKMDVYVVVSLSGDPHSKQKTKTHTDGGTNPCWNQTLRFTFDEGTALHAAWSVVFVLKHDAFGPDKDLGEVTVPIKDLLKGFEGKKEPEFLTYQVKRQSGKGKGELKLSYMISDTPVDQHKGAPVQSGYGYPAQASGSGYPPQQGAAYAYPAAPGYPPPPSGYPVQAEYPPQAGYPPQGPYGGYPPQQPAPYGYGYPAQGGYPAQKPQKPKKGGGSGMGMGLGAGLLGGAVGGLLIGEMLDDSFDCDGGDF